MRCSLAFFALTALALVGCSSVTLPGGTTRYFSNAPGGAPFFRVSSGVGGDSLEVQTAPGQWSHPHKMEPVKASEPPLSTTPGLAPIVKTALRVDNFIFIEFKPTAKLDNKPLPTPYFLLPGGFAYRVPAPRR